MLPRDDGLVRRDAPSFPLSFLPLVLFAPSICSVFFSCLIFFLFPNGRTAGDLMCHSRSDVRGQQGMLDSQMQHTVVLIITMFGRGMRVRAADKVVAPNGHKTGKGSFPGILELS